MPLAVQLEEYLEMAHGVERVPKIIAANQMEHAKVTVQWTELQVTAQPAEHAMKSCFAGWMDRVKPVSQHN